MDFGQPAGYPPQSYQPQQSPNDLTRHIPNNDLFGMYGKKKKAKKPTKKVTKKTTKRTTKKPAKKSKN